MYDKGALFLNTVRHIVNNDEKWWGMFLKYSKTFHNKIIDTETVLSFFNSEFEMDLTPVFNQYLRHAAIPKLELKKNKGKFDYRWITDEPNFNMPVDVKVNGEKQRIFPVNAWTTSKTKIKNITEVEVQTNDFFITVN
jgi:aminopeptidase N